MLEEWSERISKTACLRGKVIKKLELIGISEGHENIELDFGLCKNDCSSSTIHLIQ